MNCPILKDNENEFQYSSYLANTIGTIISKNEGKEYKCFKTTYVIKKHKELITPLLDYLSYNAYEIPYYNEEQSFSVIVIIEKNLLEILKENKIDLNKIILDELKITYTECYNTFDIKKIVEDFSNLQPFFDILNRIRKETGKSTLNETEIDEAANEYLNNKNIIKKKIY